MSECDILMIINSASAVGFPDRKVPLVAGSIGPFGAFLHDGSEYTGVYASSMSVEVW